LRCRCNPATGAHFAGWRNDGDPDKDSDPIRPPVPEFTIKPIAHIYFQHRRVAGTVEPPSVERPVTGNNPAFLCESDIPAPQYPPHAAQTAKRGVIRGEIPVANADQATSVRTALVRHFNGQGYNVGYVTATDKHSGWICVSWDTSLPKDKARNVKWEVLP
jgi:hypothetical protein